VESRNVTYVGERSPVFWEEARGANVRDADGNEYLDLSAAFGVALAGHAHPRIAERVTQQAATLMHGMGDVHPPVPKLELLERLAALAPWPDARAVLATSGSEAVEIALKTALLATGRAGVLALAGAYHGLTLGSLAVTDRELFRRPFERRLYQGVARTRFPGERDKPAVLSAALDAVERALERPAGWDPVGAVIVEPIQGRAGVRVPAPGFLAGVAERARGAGALLVCDEVLTGFGRTGAMFAHEHFGVVPDLLCVGKALGGGMPISACLGPARVMDAWPPSEGEAIHTSTFVGHPVACAAALAFLDVLVDEGLIERARVLGKLLLTGLQRGLEGVDDVVEVRGRGLLIGVELAAAGSAVAVSERALRAGLIVLPAGERGEVLELVPPAVLTEAQADHAVDAVVERIRLWTEER
jgi:4-aminobutyrate aminotransferase-like enzyme